MHQDAPDNTVVGGSDSPPVPDSIAASPVLPPAGADLGGVGGSGPVGGPGGSVAPVPPRKRRRRSRRWIVEWVVVILLALVVAVVVRSYVFQTFYIPSGSMEPTLMVGDRIIVDKLSFHLHPVERGDIVVFRRPPHEQSVCAGPEVTDLVKRVIGLPTETISAHNGVVYITGKPLSEPWLPKEYAYTATFPHGPVKIPKGDYFMMGDHRTNSCDSRLWGPLPRSYIVGEVVMRIWPPGRIHIF
ncbi:MAG: signal peptidase I [Acidimicrobiales bacterium]